MSLQFGNGTYPVMWLGGYSFKIPPTKISFDRETTIASKPILSGLEHTEPAGYTAKKLTIEGFLADKTSTVAGTPSSVVTDFWNWVGSLQTPGTTDGYFNRPFSLGIFTQDPLTFNLWYSDIAYLQADHHEYSGGYAQFFYPYRFQTIQANPVQYLATTTAINSSNVTYQFNMSGNDINGNPLTSPNGYIAGIQLLGSSIATGGTALSGSYYNNSSTLIGSLPVLGQTTNQLFKQTTPVKSGILAGSVGSPTLTLPAVENSGYQSIAILAVTGTYEITFNTAFAVGGTPSQIYLVWVPL